MDLAEKAAEIRAHEAAEDAERRREWELTRASLDVLAPHIIARCKKRHLKKTRLDSVVPHKAWTFSVYAPHRPGEATTCMHLAFYPDSSWTLLGCHDGICITPVDKRAPFHPGLRQGFVYARHRHEADVVYKLSRDQLRQLLFAEIDAATKG